MDSKGYTEKNTEYLKQISFITRVPGSFGLEGAITDQALYHSDGGVKSMMIIDEKPIKNPTLRWVFQIFEGINFVKIKIDNGFKSIINGMNSLHKKIIRLFGETTCRIYQISPT